MACLYPNNLFASVTLELLPPADEIYSSNLNPTKQIQHNIQNKHQHNTLPWVGQWGKVDVQNDSLTPRPAHSSSWPGTPAIPGEQARPRGHVGQEAGLPRQHHPK